MAIAEAPLIETPKPLSDADVQFFVENGYYAAPNLMTEEEVEELRADTAYLARGRYPCDAMQPLPTKRPTRRRWRTSYASISRTLSAPSCWSM